MSPLSKPGQILRLGQVEMRLEDETAKTPSPKKLPDQTMVIQQGVKLGGESQTTVIPFDKTFTKKRATSAPRYVHRKPVPWRGGSGCCRLAWPTPPSSSNCFLILVIRTPFENAMVVGGFGLLSFAGFRELWFRRKIRAILTRHSAEIPTLDTLNASLASLYTESPKYMFTAKQRANLSFRGRVVSFVYGLAGSDCLRSGGGWWSIRDAFYAVSDSSQSDWMTKNSDVFVPASKGQSCYVFWVKLGKLKFEGIDP